MNKGSRILLHATGCAAAFSLFLLYELSTRYIPSAALQKASLEAGNPDQSREDMFGLIRDCLNTRDLEPQDMGRRISKLYSVENDAGFLAMTRIGCDARRCSVAESALIPVQAHPDLCRKRHGRRYRSGRRQEAWLND